MPTSFEIKVDNIDEAKGALRQQTLKALEECGITAERYAKALCPVDTGNLRNSVSHKVVDHELACYVGASVEYAPYVEFGTGVHYEGGRRTPWQYQDSNGQWHTTTGNKPQPFIRPSVADHLKEYENIIKSELKS